MEKNPFAVPIAIIIAAGLLAGAIYFSGKQNSANTANDGDSSPSEEITIPPVTEADHILGNPNAPIMIVEYSDYDCPFCKNFHETMKKIMDDYGAGGKVAWVYRYFPLQQLHPNAPELAVSAECVAELGGNDAFWKFSDLVFSERDTNEQTDMTRVPEFVAAAGVDTTAFQECLDSGRYKSLVEQQFNDAVAAGGRGTPYPIVVVGDQKGTIQGAQPYSVVKQMIDTLIAQLDNSGN
ncbi:thioredoxin domain-containing protein [Candidatus Parcubacteria bacterium]|uniref:Disulfide bond formation protein DsbA n=1 Tax=Candidatus Kaiserbacteria bacterium CG10_big_fil_rev_8_21_14_0_10_47_16 TaxID=1974608 RepID=A0A2H0UCY9_9BACT|nr:thioredoxin domain-containing protein [Candidatus Parcubacteria bacterium]PIR84293.1 MAG: disulfide bond formation protein DsbA [Candidatus Kaiserbacteria bacterium CG10_big_fil_rev_8_21_14_0_10_47_16]